MTKRKRIKRENGTGSVFKRSDLKNRPWVALAPAKYNEMGEKQQATIGHYKTAIEAKEALEQYCKSPTDEYNLTVEEAFQEWSNHTYPNLSKQTQNNYNACYKKISSILRLKLRDVKTKHLQNIIDANRHLSQSSLTKIKVFLSQLLDYGMEHDIVQKNYAQYVVLPKNITTPKDSFTKEELAILEEASKYNRMASLIYTMCYTGFRLNEFLELTHNSYDSKNNTLVGGKKTKAGKNRIVPIHPKISPIVQQFATLDGETIFCKEDGRKYNDKTFRALFYETLESLNIRKLSPHTTRHTCATLLSAAGARPEDIQKILGHAKYDVTATTYIHQDLDTLQKAMNLIP